MRPAPVHAPGDHPFGKCSGAPQLPNFDRLGAADLVAVSVGGGGGAEMAAIYQLGR
jgi:hypothetical protein